MAADITSLEVRIRGDQALRTSRQLEQRFDSLGKSGKRIETQADRIGSAFSRMSRLIASGAGAFGAFTAFDRLKGAALNTEALHNQLKFATGSAIEAGQALDFVRETSERLGLVSKTAAQGFAQLANAAKGTSLAGQTVRDVFEGVAAASAVLGRTAEQTDGILLAFSQSIAKGKFQQEEILQVAERGIPIFSLLQKALGKTGDEIAAMQQKGELLTADVLPKLAKEMQRAFGKDAQDAAKGLRGEISNLQNAFDDLLVTVSGQKFKELAVGGVQVLKSAVETLNDNLDNLVTLAGLSASVLVGRLVASLTASAQAAFANIAVTRAHSLALVEDASRTVASTAAKLAFNNMLVAEAQASVAAATGLSRLSVVQNTLLPAQTRAAAAAATHTAALQAQAVAAKNASISAGLLRGSLALLGGPVGAAVIAAGALFVLTTRSSEASDAIDIAKTANEQLNEVLRDTENLTLSAAEAARTKANQDLLGAQASLIAAEAENKLVVARSGRLLAGTPLPESAGLQLTRETKEISALGSEIDKLFDKLLKADSAVKQFQRSAKSAGNDTGNLTGETGKLTKQLTDQERAQEKFNKAIEAYPGREIVRELEEQFAASDRLADSTLDIGDAMREVTEQTGPFEEAFSNTFRRIDDAGASFWQNLLEGGKSTFGSLKDLAVQTGAEILHALTTRRLTQGISNAIVPGAAAGIGAASLGGGFGFSPTSLLNAGVSPFVDASTFFQSAGLTGNLGIAAGGALPGLGVGALTTLATGGSGMGNTIGGGIGGALGNLIMPGIGGLVGSALGGLGGGLAEKLFGGSKKAKIRLGGGVGGFEDSVFSQSAFGNIGLAGSRTKRVDAAEFKPFFDSIAQLDNLMATSLIPEQIDKVRASLEGFTSQKLTSSDPFRPEQLEQLIRERMGVIFEAVGGDISRLAQSFRNLPLEQMVAGFNALNQVSRFADSRPLEDFGKALQDNNRTLQEATRQSRNAIIELVNTFDGSLDATQRLAAATQSRYTLELQLLNQINSVSAGITSSFESTRETIIRAGLSQEELFNRIASQAEGLVPQLLASTDPARIGDIAGRINQLVGESFRMLSPEQQQAVQPGFLDFLGRTEGIAQGRLADVQQTAVRENNELRKVIRDELGLAGRDMKEASRMDLEASRNNLEAARLQVSAAGDQKDAARQRDFFAGMGGR